VARDESPGGQDGVSRELVLRIPATEEQRSAARSAADSAAARAAAAAKAMQQLQQRTSDAANQRTAKPEDASKAGQPNAMKYEGAQQAKALAAEQKAMAERVQQLQQTSKALEDRMRAAGVLDTAMAGQLREAQRLLREALTPEMMEALKKLDNATQNLSQDQSKASLQQMADQQKKMREVSTLPPSMYASMKPDISNDGSVSTTQPSLAG
jgi:hypothetical protein